MALVPLLHKANSLAFREVKQKFVANSKGRVKPVDCFTEKITEREVDETYLKWHLRHKYGGCKQCCWISLADFGTVQAVG